MASMLKQRLIGAVVLIALGVIFIPMLLTGDGKFLSDDMESNVPPKPMYELEAPKVIPLDKRAVQSSGPVVEPAPQADKMDSVSEENGGSTQLANTEPVKPEASTKGSATPGESKTTDTPAIVAEAQSAPEKIPDAPAAEKPSADKVTKPETKPVEKPVAAPVTTTATKKPVVSGWAVQLGSFSVQKNALKLRDSLRKKGYASFVEEYTSNGKTSYRVRVGPELTRELASELKKKLKAETKLDGFVVEFPGK